MKFGFGLGQNFQFLKQPYLCHSILHIKYAAKIQSFCGGLGRGRVEMESPCVALASLELPK